MASSNSAAPAPTAPIAHLLASSATAGGGDLLRGPTKVTSNQRHTFDAKGATAMPEVEGDWARRELGVEQTRTGRIAPSHSTAPRATPRISMDLSSSASARAKHTSNLSGTNIQVYMPRARTVAGAVVDINNSSAVPAPMHAAAAHSRAASTSAVTVAVSLTSNSSSHSKPPLGRALSANNKPPIVTASLTTSVRSQASSLPSSTRSSPGLSPRLEPESGAPLHSFSSVLDQHDSITRQQDQKRVDLLAKVSARVEADLGDTVLRPHKRNESSTSDGPKPVVAFSLASSAQQSASSARARRRLQVSLEDDDDPSLPIDERRTRAIQWLLLMIEKKDNPLYCPAWFTAVDAAAMLHLSDVRQQYLALVQAFDLREQALIYIDDVQDSWMEQKQKAKTRSRLNMMRHLQGKTLLPTPNIVLPQRTPLAAEIAPPPQAVATGAATTTTTASSRRTVSTLLSASVTPPSTSGPNPPSHTTSTNSRQHAAPSLAADLPTPVASLSTPVKSAHSSLSSTQGQTLLGLSPIPHRGETHSPSSAETGLRFFAHLQQQHALNTATHQSPFSQLSVSADSSLDLSTDSLSDVSSTFVAHLATASTLASTHGIAHSHHSTLNSPARVSNHGATTMTHGSSNTGSEAALSQMSEEQIHRSLTSFHALLEQFPLLIKHSSLDPTQPSAPVAAPKLSQLKLIDGALHYGWRPHRKHPGKCVHLVDITAVKPGLSKNVPRTTGEAGESAPSELDEFCFHILSSPHQQGDGTIAARRHRELNLQCDSVQHRREWIEGLQLMVMLAVADAAENTT